MRAIDTNLIVRLVVRDDPEQVATAEAIIASDAFLVLPTVLLEAEWVLRSHYRFDRSRIAARLIAICGYGNARVVSSSAVLAALAAYSNRGDFGDLLHAALAVDAGATSIATFDRTYTIPADTPLELEIL